MSTSNPETITITLSGSGPAGPPGPQGPKGDPGVSEGALTFPFASAQSTWSCAHDLGRLPVSVTVYDTTGELRPFPLVENPDLNTTVISFANPLAGKAVIS